MSAWKPGNKLASFAWTRLAEKKVTTFAAHRQTFATTAKKQGTSYRDNQV
jgi:hypothetical protein